MRRRRYLSTDACRLWLACSRAAQPAACGLRVRWAAVRAAGDTHAADELYRAGVLSYDAPGWYRLHQVFKPVTGGSADGLRIGFAAGSAAPAEG